MERGTLQRRSFQCANLNFDGAHPPHAPICVASSRYGVPLIVFAAVENLAEKIVQDREDLGESYGALRNPA
jgi:hypothetical protein